VGNHLSQIPKAAALEGGAIHDNVVDRSAVTREAAEVSPVGNHLSQIRKPGRWMAEPSTTMAQISSNSDKKCLEPAGFSKHNPYMICYTESHKNRLRALRIATLNQHCEST
jgi:hypothetical protein